MRSCVVCRTVRPKRDLVRIVRTPDGAVVLDAGGRLAGRGAYVCGDGPCRVQAVERGALTRALNTSVPPEVRAGLASEAPITHTNTIQGGASGQE